MEVKLGRIAERESFSFHDRFPVSTRDGGTVECDTKVAGTVAKSGGRLLLDAEVTCGIGIACSRCLEEFTLSVKTGFSLVFHRGEGANIPGGESNVPGGTDTDDFIILSDITETRYDIFPRVKEEILLEMPIRFLCSEDCKGICSRCGADLNTGGCECDDAKEDPRWAPLKNILKKKENS